MILTVQAVDPALLIEAYKVLNDNREDDADHVVILIRHFYPRLDSDIILAISYRLIAFAHVIKKRGSSPWVIEPKDKDYILINETLLRAAANAPLNIDEDTLVCDLTFDTDDFAKYALGEPETDGRA